ncbi:MAG: nucleotide-binding protein [Betaproteobacteria bacterium RIFCSPHIGHO2_12_FULL_69_13]|nr:MAG: nucleotide-binding protein [Betaproteobacteria bacterium RIFCSPHIGHO2_12_FULL_69_13]OGA65427.1 MAG: nucleotide-binding protein [Betaproteobacteria bacterium RIFCSPLOWO2_12_FULL_68_20]
MIGLDTNVLARYYVEDKADKESVRQREAARRLMDSGAQLFACKSALLELEWVMRGYYAFAPREIAKALRHLLSLAHVRIEDRPTVEAALSHYEAGLDFADALHHASYRECEAVATFDDRKFARRANRIGVSPKVVLPK